MCAVGQFMCDLYLFYKKNRNSEFTVVNATISEQAL